MKLFDLIENATEEHRAMKTLAEWILGTVL
jgi:hypothetical protein